MIALIDRWEQTLKLQFPERDNFASVLDISAQRVLVSRFLRRLKPPEEVFKAGDDRMKRAVRQSSRSPLRLPPRHSTSDRIPSRTHFRS